MIRSIQYKKQSDCADCAHAADSNNLLMYHYSYPKGFHFPLTRCVRNIILFLIKGEALINSEEHPGATLRPGQCILQSIDSKVEGLALTDVEYMVYRFDEPYIICELRNRKLLDNLMEPITYSPLDMCQQLDYFVKGMCHYIDDGITCKLFLETKQKELIFILSRYYTTKDLAQFFYPVLRFHESFRYFVMQNYHKVKSVEEFAQLGTYSVVSFRRQFKSIFGEPAYEWMLKQRRKGILEELRESPLSISEICYKYKFDSLSHFSNFCKTCFGLSPRSLRTKARKGLL